MQQAVATEELIHQYEKELESFSVEDLLVLRWNLKWKAQARRKQLAPREFLTGKKPYWGIRSGRGFGKTLCGANWIGLEGAKHGNQIEHVIAPTYDDARYTCFEGPTGLVNVIPEPLIVDQNKSLPSLTLWNGTIFRGFAADTPNRLRGPQCHNAWAEEIATWLYPKEAWSNIEFGLRLGESPRMVWTSTPRPTQFMRDRNGDIRAVIVTGSLYENRENLADIFFENVAKYEGTAIGRQEIHGEILDPEEEGFVKRSQWQLWSAKTPLPKFKFIVMSLDTAFTEETYDKKKATADYTACTVWGVFEWKRQDNVMLIDAWQDRLGFPQLVTRTKKESDITYGDADEPILQPFLKGPKKPNHQGRRPDLILIEDKGSGISLRQALANENVFTESYNPGKLDKLARLHIVSPLFAHKRVWAVESNTHAGKPRAWADPVITQVCTYVGQGSLDHDDLLDTTTQALRLIMDKFRMIFTVKVDAEEERRKAALALAMRRRKEINPYAQ